MTTRRSQPRSRARCRRGGAGRSPGRCRGASGITQARKRLGPAVLAQVFDQVAGPQAGMLTRGAWLRSWRLVAIDGFEVDVPDTERNAAEFGYAGSGEHRSAFPKARVVALAECGTHAVLAAEIGAYSVGEKTLAKGLYGRLRSDELLTADRNFYSFEAWDLATRSGAALLWRSPAPRCWPRRGGRSRATSPSSLF